MSDTPSFMKGYRKPPEQAKLLGKTERTLAAWRKKREGPPWTLNGKDILYHDDWTAAWLRAGKKEPVRERRRSRRRADDYATGSAA